MVLQAPRHWPLEQRQSREKGRKKELFLSNHFDPQSLDCILGKCTVHTFQEYMGIEGRRSDSDY